MSQRSHSMSISPTVSPIGVKLRSELTFNNKILTANGRELTQIIKSLNTENTEITEGGGKEGAPT